MKADGKEGSRQQAEAARARQGRRFKPSRAGDHVVRTRDACQRLARGRCSPTCTETLTAEQEQVADVPHMNEVAVLQRRVFTKPDGGAGLGAVAGRLREQTVQLKGEDA